MSTYLPLQIRLEMLRRYVRQSWLTFLMFSGAVPMFCLASWKATGVLLPLGLFMIGFSGVAAVRAWRLLQADRKALRNFQRRYK